MQDTLRDIEDHDIGAAVSHFLNCFFGNYLAAGGKAGTNSSNAKTPKKVLMHYQSLSIYSSMFVHLEFMLFQFFGAVYKVSHETNHAYCLGLVYKVQY